MLYTSIPLLKKGRGVEWGLYLMNYEEIIP